MYIVSYQVRILICQDVAFVMSPNKSYTSSKREKKIERNGIFHINRHFCLLLHFFYSSLWFSNIMMKEGQLSLSLWVIVSFLSSIISAQSFVPNPSFRRYPSKYDLRCIFFCHND